jgi:hypothetical protein
MNHRLSLRPILAAARLWVLAGIFLSAPWSRADEPPATRRHMENRFLFVIDTSSAMKARSNGVEEAVNGLIESGMRGEVRKGDTIGLWTYSDQLDTDFPMEVWSEQKKDDIMKEVRAHLRHLRYEKRSHLEKALPAILQVVTNSERVTVILIFDGADLIKGTPFDKDINGLHKHYVGEFRSAHAPFVTLLAARNGAVFDYTINYPGTVMVPHTADPLPPPQTNTPQTLIASAPPPPEEPAPAPASVPPPPAKVQIVLSGSDFAHKAGTPAPAAASAVAVVTPAPASAPVAASNVPSPAEAAPAVVQAAQTNVAPAEPERAPPPATIVTPPAKPAPAAAAPSPISTAAAPAAPVAAGPVAPAVVAATTGQLAAMFIIAFSLLTIAVVLVLLLVRRWRGPQPSLISQSIDRTR